MQKSFILFQEYQKNISALSQNQKGDLLDAIFAFNAGQEIELDPITNMAFSFIRSDLERNKEKWSTKREERSVSGRMGNLKRWHRDLFKKVNSNKITLEEAENIASDRKSSLSDNSESLKSQTVAKVAVNGNVNVNVNGNVNNKIEIPDFIEKDLWNGFVEMRKATKSPLTDTAVKLIIKKLKKFKEKGLDPNVALSNSIENNWKGVFEPKQDKQNASSRAEEIMNMDLSTPIQELQ